MPSSPMPATQLVFDDFLESLRLRDFPINTGHFLRLHKLLARIGPNCKPHDVKTILCPIFATNDREQERFYEQFDAYFSYESSIESGAEAIESISAGAEPEVDKQGPRKKKGRAQILGLLFLGLIVAIILSVIVATRPDDTFPTNNSPTPTPTPTASISTPTPPPFSFLLFNKLRVEPSTLSRILLASLPLIAFAIYEFYKRIRRRQRRQDLDDRDQPGIPITFGASLGEVYDADDLTRVARLLRARQRSGELQLDIIESVIATVRALGFFTLREKAVSKPPEYLVLVDRAAFRDHQARLFYELARKLNVEGVFVTCYYFEGDPRVSFIWPFESSSTAPVVRSPEAQQKIEEEARRAQRGVTIEDLHDLYTGHRLLIFGEGTDLVDPLTLQTVDWIKSFTHWQDRAILTPRPPTLWDAHELALSQQFVVMPATLQGVELTAESFSIREPVSIPGNLRGDSSLPPHDIDSPEDLPELRSYLGERVFQWLSACAVHPQLQWDLTMSLGEQFSHVPQVGAEITKGKPVESLFTEENLLRLFNLSWFRVGTIPDEVRFRLMRQLTARSEATVRQTIAELREKAAASEISLDSLGAVRVPLPQEFAGQVPVQHFQRFRNLRDVAFKRFLQPQPLVLFLKNILPSWLQRLLFTPFGLRTGVRVALVALVSLFVWVTYPTLAAAFAPAFGTNVNANTNVNINTNGNANANESVTPISVNTNANASPSPLQSPSLSPSPSAAPASPSPLPSVSFSPPPPSPIPSVSFIPPPTPSTPTPTATATPTPTPVPTQPPPSPSASLVPRGGIVRFTGSESNISPRQTVQLAFYVRQARRVRITPADGDLADWNKRFAATAEIQDFQGVAKIQPLQTTTYTITAEVVESPMAQSFKTVSQELTIFVMDRQETDPVCVPGRYNFPAMQTRGGSIRIAIAKKCADKAEQWTMTLNYDSAKAPPGTVSYDANGPDEEEAMRGLSRSRGLPSSFVNAIEREVYPVLSSGDPLAQRKVADAMKRALRSVK